MPLDDVIAAYGDTYDQLRLATGDLVEQLWLQLGGPDDRRALEAAEAIVATVNDATVATAELVDGYVAEYVGTATRSAARPAGASPLDLAQYVIDELRNARGLDVYRRPAVEVRTALANGVPFEEAMARAGRRANAMAQADIGLAHRQAGVDAMSADPAVDGYRRVLTGASCLLCAVASTQRYRSSELMPIHTRCDCRVAPIVGGTDYGHIVNRQLYNDLRQSGKLDKLNRSNRGRSGQSRARSAAANRARQEQLAGIGRGVQPELDLRRPPSAGTLADDLAAGGPRRTTPTVGVREHGELGPVLVNDRHAFTSVSTGRAGAHRLEADLDTVRATPAPPPTSVKVHAPDAGDVAVDATRRNAAGTTARPPRYTATSPEVMRAAARRGVDAEQVAAELNAKAQRRAREAAEARAYRRSLTPEHPDVIRAAERAGVSPDEVLVGHAQLGAVRHDIAVAAARVQAETYGDLYQWDALKVAAPGRSRTAEYDWLGQLDARERARLSRKWYDQSGAAVYGPDQLAENIGNALGRDLSVDEAMDVWLDRTRRYEAAGALRAGKLPSLRAYSEAIDVDGLLGAGDYLPSRVLGVDDLDAAAYIAARNRDLLGNEALQYLGNAANPVLGPSPYRMSFPSWEAEVRELEHFIRQTDEAVVELDLGDDVVVRLSRREAEDRLEELVPPWLDEPDTGYEELYARIVHTAQRAGEDVPAHARIPWDNVDEVVDEVRPASVKAGGATYQATSTEEVAGLWSERNAGTFKPGSYTPAEAAAVANTLEDLSRNYPLLHGHELGDVGDLTAVFGSNIPKGGLGVQGMARSPGIRITEVDGRLVARIRGTGELGVRAGTIDSAFVADKAATGYLSTTNPAGVIVHEYGHHLGYGAEVELVNRYLTGELKLAGRAPVNPDALAGRLWEQEAKRVLRDALGDVELPNGRLVRDLPANASFAQFAPAVRSELSAYGASDPRELVAEAFAEYVLDGPNARPAARAIAERMLELVSAGTSRLGGLE